MIYINFYHFVSKYLFTKFYLTFCFGINFIVMLWQKTRLIRLLFLFPHCRFYPSCSDYTYQAFKEHGLIYGFILSMSRLFRCHPLCKGGIDEVPKVGI